MNSIPSLARSAMLGAALLTGCPKLTGSKITVRPYDTGAKMAELAPDESMAAAVFIMDDVRGRLSRACRGVVWVDSDLPFYTEKPVGVDGQLNLGTDPAVSLCVEQQALLMNSALLLGNVQCSVTASEPQPADRSMEALGFAVGDLSQTLQVGCATPWF